MSLPGSQQHILLPKTCRSIFFSPELKEPNNAKANMKPIHLLLNTISQKCLDLMLINCFSDSGSEIEDNKSCHCRNCGHQSKKMKHIKRKCRRFSPVMHEILRKRRTKLRQKFRNAVYAILWILKLAIERKKKKMQVRKIIRLKTRVLEVQPDILPMAAEQQIIYIEVHEYNRKAYSTSISVNDRLQTQIAYKLHDQDTQKSNSHLSLPKLKQLSIFSQSHSKIMSKIFMTSRDESSTPKRSNLHSIVKKASPPKTNAISPYLRQPQLALHMISCSEQSVHSKQPLSRRTSQKKPQDFFGKSKFHQRKFNSYNSQL